MSDLLNIDADATRWAPAHRDGLPLLVMLHGYGSDENDLFALRPFLPEGIAVASVAAPLTPPWPSPGRSWYPIEGLESRSSEGTTAAAEALLRWLDAEAADVPKVALLGFSQGAAVSLQAMRLDAARFGAIVALSGYATPGDLPDDEGLRASKPRVFWGRGTNDDVIPQPLIDHTAQWLPDHSDLTGRVYPGLTHSVSEDELLDVRVFLEKWLDDSAD
ncbi:alpha/beta hydrolase [Microbacterium sp.]|uniref:alpha/beta hydrolase n=1 Tax=Microbacterium sp. TaxID=51671 RepID=UPI002CE96C22|nr:alpha/beta hydrolase-fold protein [Microbacterium sp.]HWK78442.1 alpha/beta hydrolase-fold protein [Microbacterium sp.]